MTYAELIRDPFGESDKRRVTQTSIEAYRDILPTLSKRQRQVYYTLRAIQPANNTMISRELGLPINTITPRVKELREKGVVKQAGIKKCPYTGKNTTYWETTNKRRGKN